MSRRNAKTGRVIGSLVSVLPLTPRCDEYALQMRLIALAKARGRKIDFTWFGVGFGFSMVARYVD